jgi:hypothetical protein
MKGEMDRTCSTHGGIKKCIHFLVRKPEQKRFLTDLSVAFCTKMEYQNVNSIQLTHDRVQ